MKLRVLMMIVPWLLICCSGHRATESVRPSAERPNFIVVILDDWGQGDAGIYGHPLLETPHIDAIAQNGMVFDNAFLTTSSCSASRASILTGLYPHATGAPNLHDELPPDSVLMSDHLKKKEYYTAAAGKWHLGAAAISHFDQVIDSGGDSGAEDWLAVLRQRPQEKPFFLWFGSRDPHLPYAPLVPTDRYQAKDVASVSPFMVNGEKTRINMAQYYNEVNRVDRFIGEVVAELKNQGIDHNTYVIVMSDNGAPFPRAKTTLYDSGIRTPFVIQGPLIEPTKRASQMISSIDLAPTILELAHISPDPMLPGKSFVSVFGGGDKKMREYIYAEQFNHGYEIHKQAIRTENFLYIKNIIQGNKNSNNRHCLLEMTGMREDLVEQLDKKSLTDIQERCFLKKWPAEELYDNRWDPDQIKNLMIPNIYQEYIKENGDFKRGRILKKFNAWMDLEATPQP